MKNKPKKPETLTKPRAFRVSVDLWEKLTKASAENHRSITGELAYRLEKTFEGKNQ